jgi:hypothetical protein
MGTLNFAQSSEISSSQYLQKCWQISGVHFKIDSSHKFTTLSRSIIGLTKPLCHFNWVVVSSLSVLHIHLVRTYDSIYTQKELDFIVTY